ncbi:MAG: YqgE/AlgH family protein [Steroidobacteraceae bacterium]
MSAPTLANHLLIAMPTLNDPNFSHTVTLVCEHAADTGALGIVINKPLPMQLSEVFSQMKLEPRDEQIASRPVLRGGPVRTEAGFVVHRPGGSWDKTLQVSDLIQITTSRDVLVAMARGEGPADAFIALGCAGWGAGQLEREIRENAWLPMAADERVVFGMPFEQRWQGSWELVGVDMEKIRQMSLVAGNA